MDRSPYDAVVPDVFDVGAVEILGRQSGVAGNSIHYYVRDGYRC